MLKLIVDFIFRTAVKKEVDSSDDELELKKSKVKAEKKFVIEKSSLSY